MCAQVQRIHRDQSSLVFLSFDDAYKTSLEKNDQSNTVDFDDKCHEQIVAAFERKKIQPRLLIFRYVPDQGMLYLPQSIDLNNECKDEVQVRSLPLFIYDEMLPVL